MNKLKHIPCTRAISLALGQSGLSRECVAHHMGWNSSHTNRIFNSEDSYFPALPSIPKLCSVLGNDIIIDWLRVNAHELRQGRHDLQEPLTTMEVLQLLSQLGEEMGAVNAEVNEALKGDNKIQKHEAPKIIKKAHRVLAHYQELIIKMYAVDEE